MTIEDAESMRVAYFNDLGWDLKTGKPSKERLLALGLDDVPVISENSFAAKMF